MRLLLDTHAFIWWDGEQSKLSAEALLACQSPTNSLHLSLASVWELQIKMQLGKLALRLPLADVLRDQLIDPQKGISEFSFGLLEFPKFRTEPCSGKQLLSFRYGPFVPSRIRMRTVPACCKLRNLAKRDYLPAR